MSRFLIAVAAGGGNIPPTLSVARALLDRGHDVRVITDPVLEPEVRAAGAEFVSWSTAPHRFDLDPSSDLARDWEARTPMGSLARARDAYFCGPALAFADDVRAELERRPTDAAAGEMLTFGSMIGARGAGVPCAILSSTMVALRGWGAPPFGPGVTPATGRAGRVRDRLIYAISDRMWNKGLPAINDARRAHGLAPLRHSMDQLTDCDRLLMLSTRALEYPGFDPPEHVQITGARLEDPQWTEPAVLPPGDEPLVLVGLSSTFMDQSSAIGRIAQALGTLPVRGLITTGPAVDPDTIQAPANVQVVRSAPHSELLPHTAAMVTHAGHGSVVKALAAGVPMVMMPFGRDQVEIAARAAYAGTGVRVRPGAGPARIARAVHEVLGDSAYREAARRAARTIAAEQSGDAAADALEELAGTSRSGGTLSGAGAAAFGSTS
ncbi:MAG: glycosyltransferase [Solirubrobacterales bacterium]|nr:glycosyltransferase [Solirubrobacterales bacterium]